MARRGKTSPAEEIMDLVAMLPWWVGVVLALVSYLLLHSAASQQVVATAQPGQVGAMVTQTLWKTLAGVGQYILPILCLAGAGMSAWRRSARQNLVTDVAQSKLPPLREADGAADGQARRQCRQRVLGLHGLSGMSWHAADRLTPPAVARPDWRAGASLRWPRLHAR